MTTYNYTRHLVGGSYDINNKLRVDGEGHQIYLYQEIDAQPTLNGLQKIVCDEADCQIIFDRELTSEEETLLNNVVTTHQDNL